MYPVLSISQPCTRKIPDLAYKGFATLTTPNINGNKLFYTFHSQVKKIVEHKAWPVNIMQTILGANGQIANELALELKRAYTSSIKLVSRRPQKVNNTDELFPADLLHPEQTMNAVRGSEIAYFTVGLPVDTPVWKEQFPVIMQNVIDACKKHSVRFVFFDNTYMYPQTGVPLYEETEFAPNGEKGKVRALLATMLLNEMKAGAINGMICRAPEFYGTRKTESITNSLVFANIKKGKKPQILLRDDKLRTLIWTPDASNAMALLANTPDCYNQTWHLPCDDNRLTYKQLIQLVSEIYGEPFDYKVLSKPVLMLASLFNKRIREIQELFPRYEHDNIFESTKFKKRFPNFAVTTYRQGVQQMYDESIGPKR